MFTKEQLDRIHLHEPMDLHLRTLTIWVELIAVIDLNQRKIFSVTPPIRTISFEKISNKDIRLVIL